MKTEVEDANVVSTYQGIQKKSQLKSFVQQHLLAFACMLIILFAAILRFHDLGHESLWLDEVIMARITRQDMGTVLQELQATDRSPVYVILSTVTTQLFGETEAGFRALSALAGIAAVAMIFAVGSELFGKKVGLISAAVMSVSLFQISYSQEHRYYSLLVLLTLVAAFFYIRMLKSGKKIDFVLFGVFSVLIVYNHVFGVFVLAAWGLHFLLHWGKYRSLRWYWLVTQVVVLVIIMPALWDKAAPALGLVSSGPVDPLASATDPTDWISVPPITAPLHTMLNFMFLDRRFIEKLTLVLGMVALVAGLLLTAWGKPKGYWKTAVQTTVIALRHALRTDTNSMLLVICWLLCPIVLAYGISLTLAPIYIDRYLITASPALFVLIGYFISRIQKFMPEVVFVGVIFITMIRPLQEYFLEDTKEQWREIADYVSTNIENGDAIAVVDAKHLLSLTRDVNDSFYWYYSGEPTDCYLDLELDSEMLVNQMQTCGSTSGRLWFIVRNEESGRERLESLWEFLEDRNVGGVGLIDRRKFIGIEVYLIELPVTTSNRLLMDSRLG
jgi:hypothetical protein